ncbi:hypothetical protein [Flavobacterium pectinovorum]|uniref:Uncharacterized protein n=1 Tax=Flavobacterium pectinovorum TaxID=29533 RepID=A0A502E0V8_9FLAO|nr:hypothetical protein [Flavobacterium pectinovorum]TPG31345.1 hypothetical protein EAH81_26835 [Flavobacterium pectinovorum]
MIKNWIKTNENGIQIPIDIFAPHLFYFDKIDKNLKTEFLEGKRFGIAWEYNGTEVSVFDNEGSVEGFPTANLQYIVAIFRNSNLYPHPNNAIIFNLDGSLKKILQFPKFKSEIILTEIEKNNQTNPPLDDDRLCFYKYSRQTNDQGIEFDILEINYDLEYSESQILDSDTLELTHLLKSRFDRYNF